MGAILSKCRQYRYSLSRNVDMFGSVTFAYFGINPSTADETTDDNTVKKWIGFTIRNDGASFIVGNAFAYRATNVNELRAVKDPIGPENDYHLKEIIAQARL